MFENVSHLLFDLDDTLWDCAGNSVLSLRTLYDRHSLSDHFESFDSFNAIYQHINDELWGALPDSGMTVAEVRVKRFEETLNAVGLRGEEYGAVVNDEYMRLMVKCPGTMPDAVEVVKDLSQRYKIEIITNGIDDVQRGKLAACGIEQYVNNIFVSDKMGAMKPKREYFSKVMETLGCTKTECLVIGDNPKTDIKGAEYFGLMAIWYNWRHLPENDCQCEAVIYDLRRLCEIL